MNVDKASINSGASSIQSSVYNADKKVTAEEVSKMLGNATDINGQTYAEGGFAQVRKLVGDKKGADRAAGKVGPSFKKPFPWQWHLLGGYKKLAEAILKDTGLKQLEFDKNGVLKSSSPAPAQETAPSEETRTEEQPKVDTRPLPSSDTDSTRTETPVEAPSTDSPSEEAPKIKWVQNKAADIAPRIEIKDGKIEYTVQSGDTLWQIAEAIKSKDESLKGRSTSSIVDSIVAQNSAIKDKNKIYVGNKLAIDVEQLKSAVEAPKKEETAPPKKEETAPPKKEETAPPKKEETAPPKKEETAPPKKEETAPPKKEETAPPKKEETSRPAGSGEAEKAPPTITQKQYTWKNLWGYNFGLW